MHVLSDMQRGLATRKMSVRPSDRLPVSNAWFVTKQKKNVLPWCQFI